MNRHSISSKKRTVKNIYCSTCDQWLSEFYRSCHLKSVFHETRFKNTSRQSTQTEVSTKPTSTPDDSQNDSFLIEGSALNDCIEDLVRSSSPDLFSEFKLRLFEQEQEGEYQKLDEIPQNQLGIVNYDAYQSVASSENVLLFSNNTTHCENAQDGTEHFPLNILGGTFPDSQSTHFHYNQMAELRCSQCHPASYKDYEDSQDCSFHFKIDSS